MSKLNVVSENGELTITIKMSAEMFRSNPYMEEGEYCGLYPALTGVIEKDKFGFAHTIDMDYKGKSDQWTEPFIDLSALGVDEAEFIKMCEDNNIPYTWEDEHEQDRRN